MKQYVFLFWVTCFTHILCAPAFADKATNEGLSQAQLAELAKHAELKFGVIGNYDDVGDNPKIRFTLINHSNVALPARKSNWRIYFHGMRKFTAADSAPVRINRVVGDVTEIVPTDTFPGLASSEVLEINANASSWVVTENDFMPRAFIVADGLTPEVIANTDTESFGSFVEPFKTPQQQLRFGKEQPDLFSIATAESRFKDNLSAWQTKIDPKDVAQRIIPTPVSTSVQSGKTVVDSSWKIRFAGQLAVEANYFQQQLGAMGLRIESAPDNEIANEKTIVLGIGKARASEGYELKVDAQKITINGFDNAGVFYGIQSLLSVMPPQFSGQLELPRLNVTDYPRYKWRGMHYDMARNFHGKAVTLRLIEQMAHYKLNKLHLHLADDEGWRIEIPGLPELTEIGAKRCFDPSEQKCLMTQLGTGALPSGTGNGFYSAQDFVEILKFAASRHIDVIPEIDMPGHARAAIKSMQARYNKLMALNKKDAAEQYLLSDPNDRSEYMTVQSYTDNALNVCLPSSYVFVDKVVYELQQMYRKAGITLSTFHMGGDEVGKGAWQKSAVCEALFAKGQPGLVGVADLKPYFVEKVAQITHARGLNLAGWEDGLMYDPATVFNRKRFVNDDVIAMAWDNIWEAGVADRAYRLANADYKVVLVPSSHLYFDHPHEANFDERGAYWATRYSDTRKVFEFMPDNYYANADRTAEGKPITNLEALVGREMVKLKKPENILGIQGAIWTEFVRTPEQVEQMIYPRIIALSERAWHKANWEADKPAVLARERDWSIFSKVLVERSLPKLRLAGVTFYLPAPGGLMENGTLVTNTAFPGLDVQYSVDGGVTWELYKGPVNLAPKAAIQLRSRLGNSYSKVTSI